jgi:catechol 2,3-dioxygenase-like lactoylglutathione lyase family enzyme
VRPSSSPSLPKRHWPTFFIGGSNASKRRTRHQGICAGGDPEISKAFYTDLGFAVNWSNPEISELQLGTFRFLLQKFYVAEHAGNFMMSLTVENADAWWDFIQAQALTKKYPGIMCKAPAVQPWGMRVLYLSDPSGVLWHIVEKPQTA